MLLLPRVQRQWKPNHIIARTACLAISKRTFFASSTDFTRLLKEAEVHCLPVAGNNNDSSSGITTVQYIMAAQGTDPDTVRNVPQLHLARLFVHKEEGKTHQLYGAKVINKTLGQPVSVCDKLVDAALTDASGVEIIQANSTLHGLSQWVLDGLNDSKKKTDPTIDGLTNLKDSELSIIKDIAKGKFLTKGAGNKDDYQKVQNAWEKLAMEYLEKGLGEEAALYAAKGAKLTAIQHLTDTSDYANASGGSMALFSF